MHLYKKKRKSVLLRILFPCVLFCTLFVLYISSVKVENTAEQQQVKLLKEALDQAVVSCYAAEGRYPERLNYLVENYGIQINSEKYIVVYDIFAENVRPRIEVLQIGE